MSDALSPALLLQQEADSRLRQFDFQSAWRLGQLIQARAAEQQLPVAIEVYAFGQQLFLAALPGSAANNLEWMRRKRNTVLRYANSSMYVGVINAQNGEPMATQSFINQYDYTDHGGAFPLLNESGALFGAVSVSGLPSADDHALALWGIRQLQQPCAKPL
ncbi:heme-degrading domain-containing protein [Erwiniaceae bacterium BAC15a-03b]|uniref:Heme-degrading domain-containing protein n=1 Tax=Winslowiella arboricola TaxID=2978220 RepID=A0A9J6PL01_9GAMM|nr:heme-degrading domain-containing protein [Winslowiella arboricola]MCU5774532.1 heme-degrading domain-containing protein [Winslowiella arboricola]MCU5778058.1 heme-degrading domain-containing protein [Winslowiella arboricola]